MYRKIFSSLLIMILCFGLISMSVDGKADAKPATPEDVANPLCGDDPTLVGCWTFNEGSGATVFDGSVHTNDGTMVNDSTSYPMWVADRAGNPGQALHFAGGTAPNPVQYVQVPDAAILDISGDITIAVWVKPNQVKTQDLVKKAVNGATDGYEFSLSTSTGNCISPALPPCAFGRFNQVSNPSVPEKYRIDSLTTYSASDPWTFYAITYTTADNTMRLYRNGTISNSRVPATALTIVTNTVYLGFGAELNSSGNPTNARAYNGSLDDIRIYNRALDATQILALYSAPTAVNLVGFKATATPHTIQLAWQSVQETELLGFNLYRAESDDGTQIKLNSELIVANNPGQLQGNGYQYLDKTVETSKTYYYWVEWVGNRSTETFGPATARLAPFWLWMPIGLK